MAGSKMKISGNKLRLIAGIAENPVLGNLIKSKMMRQMGLDKLWTAAIAEDEPPFLLPCNLDASTLDEREGGRR